MWLYYRIRIMFLIIKEIMFPTYIKQFTDVKEKEDMKKKIDDIHITAINPLYGVVQIYKEPIDISPCTVTTVPTTAFLHGIELQKMRRQLHEERLEQISASNRG